MKRLRLVRQDFSQDRLGNQMDRKDREQLVGVVPLTLMIPTGIGELKMGLSGSSFTRMKLSDISVKSL